MFYMPTSYSQTESDEFLQDQIEQPQQQVCAEGEVFNEQTQICESITLTETPTETPPTDEIQMDTNGDGVVDELDEVPQTPTGANTTTTTTTTTTTEATTSGKVFKNFKSANYPCEWDLNGDGTIDANDDPKLFWDGKIPVKYNEKVVALQTYLTDLGYGPELEPEGIDGKFGPHTKNAVMAYQQNKGLIVDGIVGPNTWRALCDDIYFLLKED